MGEYLTDRQGDTICKLGVCDDWRYVRHSECEILAPRDGKHNTDIDAAMEDPATLYRFPFPDEDGINGRYPTNAIARKVNERNMFRTVSIPLPLTFVRSLCDHKEKWQHIKATDGGHGLNVKLPCPCTEGFSKYVLGHSPLPETAPILIMGERYKDGRVRTIFSCGYCEAMFSLSEADTVVVRQAMIDKGWSELAERVYANVQ